MTLLEIVVDVEKGNSFQQMITYLYQREKGREDHLCNLYQDCWFIIQVIQERLSAYLCLCECMCECGWKRAYCVDCLSVFFFCVPFFPSFLYISKIELAKEKPLIVMYSLIIPSSSRSITSSSTAAEAMVQLNCTSSSAVTFSVKLLINIMQLRES